MRLFDMTLPTPEANLAVDEALLNASEGTALGEEDNYADVLRLWESPSSFVVIGRGSKRQVEANVEACDRDGVPILRRCSGGTSVVAGPGCFMYAVILSYERQPDLKPVDAAHQFVMTRMRDALSTLSADVQFRGSCDLAWPVSNTIRKFSGNSLRCKRRHLLYHGTVLYDFALENISRWLGNPPRMPKYRGERSHDSFVTNFPYEREQIRQAIISAWNVTDPLDSWPQAETEELIKNQYSQDAWNLRL